MARLTTELLVRLRDGVTAPAKAAAAAIRGIGRAQAEANSRPALGARLAAASERASARVDAMRGRMVDAAAAGYLLTRAISSPIKAAMEFESAMADVRKVVDFPTPRAFADMQKSIRELAKQIPVSANGLAEITAAAGQAGIAGDELLPFVENAAKIGTAFDIAAGDAGEAMAKLRTGLGITNDEVFLLADAMNHLSNTQASTASEILDVVKRVGASGKQFGFTATQTAAFASAMIASGAESEVAATSFRNLGKALTMGSAATKAQSRTFKRLGLDSVKVAADMQKDAIGTVVGILERINELPKEVQAEASFSLFGGEARALGPLITNLDLLKQSLGLVADSELYKGSAQREFEVRAKTSANAMQLFRNRVNDLGIVIGSILLPALNSIMESLAPVISGIADFAEAHPTLTRNVIAATAAIVGLRVAMTALSWATGFGLAGVLGGAAKIAKLPGALKVAGGAMLVPFTRLGTHIKGVFQTAAMRFGFMKKEIAAGAIGLGGILRGSFATGARAITGLLAPIALVRGAMAALRLAVIGTGIGAALVGIAAAGTWIYNNWTGITTAFEAFKGAFDRAIEPVRGAIQPVLDIFGQLGDTFASLTGQVDPLGGKWAALGIKLGTGLGEAIVSIVQGFERLIGVIGRVANKIAGFLAPFRAEFDQAKTVIRTAIEDIVGLMMGLGSRLLALDYSGVVAGLVSVILSVPLKIALVPLEIIGIFTGIDLSGAAATMIATFTAKVREAVAALGSYVRSAIAAMFNTPAQQASRAGSLIGSMAGPAPAAGPDLPGRATGGPVKKGRSYWVGEEGIPEVFTPGADGFITPKDKIGAGGPAARPGAPSPSAQRGPGTVTISPVFHIAQVTGVPDLEARLEEFARRMKADFDSAMGGLYSDA